MVKTKLEAILSVKYYRGNHLRENLQTIAVLYNLNIDEFIPYPSHEGGRNLVYRNKNVVVRISTSKDRNLNDYLAETEYVHYLAQNGADCVDVIPSVNGNLVEIINESYVSVFTVAEGDQIAAHGYRYLEGVSISKYFYDCGKVIGKIHSLSKEYEPKNKRFDFFDKYNEVYFDSLIPSEYTSLKESLSKLLAKLHNLEATRDNYGMVHFDFSDGNYNINYKTGKITTFDFENCRTFFYLFDLANLWTHGVGWIAGEQDVKERQKFMQEYFKYVLDGYQSQTEITKEMLNNLPLLIQAVLMENIIDKFEVQKAETGSFELDEEQAYKIECMIKNIEFMGFYSEIYDSENPFEISID